MGGLDPLRGSAVLARRSAPDPLGGRGDALRCWGITKELRRCRRVGELPWPFCSNHRRQWLYFGATLLVSVLASYVAIYVPDIRSRKSPPELELPSPQADLELVAGGHEQHLFWLYNNGAAAAQSPKYGFVVFDLDAPDETQPRRILQIPFKLLPDYVLPGKALGPWNIMSLSSRAREVPIGHRVFGYVSLQCLNCVDVRYYWLFVDNGKGGWLRKLPPAEVKVANKTLARVVYAGEQAAAQVDVLIPKTGRVPFEQL